jgi:hypothetical protein
MAVLPTGFGKSLPFGKSTTNKNKFKQRMTKRSYAVTSASGLVAFMQDQEEGMSKYQI